MEIFDGRKIPRKGELLMGVLHYKRKEYRQAIPELSRSMDLLPTKPAAAYRSKSYEAIGDLENAKKYARMAM
ncbi:MAG: hypothetical protein C3F14_03270 [Deltaproteobacteria bacterium]|nr:MAG: hypothetical protein C3F14_03270 [Deltaproteobacteria bacterium]